MPLQQVNIIEMFETHGRLYIYEDTMTSLNMHEYNALYLVLIAAS